MPEWRLAKARRSLPSGYQFGDAGPSELWRADNIRPYPVVMVPSWRVKQIETEREYIQQFASNDQALEEIADSRR